MIEPYAIGLVSVGIVILVFSYIPIHKVIAILPPGTTRRSWFLLMLQILFFVGGYVFYLYFSWGTFNNWQSLIVPLVFFFGAFFVFFTSKLSLNTANAVRRVEILEKETITDPLTGVHNRRFLERKLIDEILIARDENQPLTIFLIDIDDFKKINDTFGHQIGDMVLRSITEVVDQNVRKTDTITRYGGDEFLIIAPNLAPESATIIAERVRSAVELHRIECPFETIDDLEICLTVSVGVAICNDDKGCDVQELIRKADNAVYSAKEKGGNLVVIA